MRTRAALIVLAGLFMTACATMGPPPVVGVTTPSEIIARHGNPAMQWQEADGTLVHVFPTGPNGTSTIFARFDARQRLKSYEEVLDSKHFAMIQEGMTMEQVQRIIGPPWPGYTSYFKSRDELVWEWRYCDGLSEASRFSVLFDGTSKRVRSTISLTEAQIYGGRRRACGHAYIQVGGAALTLP